MELLFIESPLFEKYRNDYLTDDEYLLFQKALLKKPDSGDVIIGTGGLRKIRWAAKGKGKRGGVRIIYYWLTDKKKVLLITIYGKGAVENIPASVLKNIIKKLGGLQ